MRGLAPVVLALLVSSAHAQDDVEVQRMRFIERGANLTATGNVSRLFDASAYENLSSGFPTTIVIGAAVYPRNGSEPITVASEIRTVVYDLWDEQYVIRTDDGRGTRRTRKVKYRAEALKILTAVEDMPIGALATIPYEDVFYLRMTVQLNPVSKETLAEVRRWLSKGGESGGVFFASFVSVFVNPKVAEADRVVRIRSQPFYRPRP
jgi:hypothetical protein